MTDDPFATNVGSGGGAFWKPADHAGSIHIFLYPKDGGTNVFGNECVVCECILVLKDGEVIDTYTGGSAEVSQVALRTALDRADAPVVPGRISMEKMEKSGRDAWVLQALDDDERAEALKAFHKVCEQVDGHWMLVTDPTEAPF